MRNGAVIKCAEPDWFFRLMSGGRSILHLFPPLHLPPDLMPNLKQTPSPQPLLPLIGFHAEPLCCFGFARFRLCSRNSSCECSPARLLQVNCEANASIPVIAQSPPPKRRLMILHRPRDPVERQEKTLLRGNESPQNWGHFLTILLSFCSGGV